MGIAGKQYCSHWIAVWSDIDPLTNDDFSYADEDFSCCGGKSIFLTHSHTRNFRFAIELAVKLTDLGAFVG